MFEKYTLLKIEYISQKIYDWWLYFFQWPIFLEYLVFWLIWPIISTIVILAIIPPISNYVYIRDMWKFKKVRIIAKREMERDIEELFLVETRKDNHLLEEVEAELEKKNKLLKEIENSKKEINKNKSQEDKWNEEYEKIDLNLVETLKNIHYQDWWNFRRSFWNEEWKYPMNIIMKLESNWLFKMKTKYDWTITEKGMFFMKQLSQESDI